MPAEAYRVRAAVEPGTVVDHDSMGRHELAGLLEGIATRLRESELTEITHLWIAPADEGSSAQWAYEHGGGAYRAGDTSDVPRPPDDLEPTR
jgi:hypothetical protein